MPTLKAYRQELGRQLNDIVIGTTTAAGTVATIIDTTLLKSSLLSAQNYIGNIIYPTTLAVARRVATYAPTTGTLTSDQDWASAPGTSAEYELHRLLTPAEKNACINTVLRNMAYRSEALLTLVTDGDMETSGVTNWTASSATLTKSTTAANVFRGIRSLRVANSGANGYAGSVAVNVVPNDAYEVIAAAQVASGTARLRIWDNTNSVEIAAIDSSERDWVLSYKAFTIPATCRALVLRLQGVEATADVYWDHVSLLPTQRNWYALPSWIIEPGQVEDVWFYPLGHSFSTDLFYANDTAGYPWQGWKVQPNATAQTPFSVVLDGNQVNVGWLEVFARRVYDELSVDTDAAVAKLDYVVSGALYHAYKRLAANQSNSVDRKLYEQQALIAERKYMAWRRAMEAPPRTVIQPPVFGVGKVR